MSEINYSKDIGSLKNTTGILTPSQFAYVQSNRARTVLPQQELFFRYRDAEAKRRSDQLAYQTGVLNFQATKQKIADDEATRKRLTQVSEQLPSIMDDGTLSTEEQIGAVNKLLVDNPRVAASFPSIGKNALDTLQFKAVQERQAKVDSENERRRVDAEERGIRQATLTVASSVQSPEGQKLLAKAQEDYYGDHKDSSRFFQDITNILSDESRVSSKMRQDLNLSREEARRQSAAEDRNLKDLSAYESAVDRLFDNYKAKVDTTSSDYIIAQNNFKGQNNDFVVQNERKQRNEFLQSLARFEAVFNSAPFRLDMTKIESLEDPVQQVIEAQRQLRKASRAQPKPLTEEEIQKSNQSLKSANQ